MVITQALIHCWSEREGREYEYSEALRAEKRKMKALQKTSRTVRETLNAHKEQIDQYKALIERKRKMTSELEMNTTDDGDMIIDEEEFKLMNQLKGKGLFFLVSVWVLLGCRLNVGC